MEQEVDPILKLPPRSPLLENLCEVEFDFVPREESIQSKILVEDLDLTELEERSLSFLK